MNDPVLISITTLLLICFFCWVIYDLIEAHKQNKRIDKQIRRTKRKK